MFWNKVKTLCVAMCWSQEWEEKQNSHSNFYEISSKTTLPSDNENKATPNCSFYSDKPACHLMEPTALRGCSSCRGARLPNIPMSASAKVGQTYLSFLGLWGQQRLELVEVCVESVQDRKWVKVAELRRGLVLLCAMGRLYSVCFACRAWVSL